MGWRGTGAALLTVLLVIGVGAAGYFVGESNAPTGEEIAGARHQAEADARRAAFEDAVAASRERGVGDGLVKGRSAGQREGSRAGRREGSVAASEEIATVETVQAGEAEEAAPTAATPEPAPGTAGSDVCVEFQDYVPGVGCVPPVAPGETEAPVACPPGQVPAGTTGACAPRG